MAESLLVIAEQRQGQLNPVSLETLVAAQRAAQTLGGSVIVALPGQGSAELLGQFASHRVDQLVSLEDEALGSYNPDAYASAVENLVRELQPGWVFFPHTYQVRDFAPRVAARFGCSLISDCVDIRADGGALLCVRQLFQGKLNADVAPVGNGPHFASFQPAAFSVGELQASDGSCAVETRQAALQLTPRVVMSSPEQEAGGTVDLGQADIVVSVGRGIQEEGNVAIAQQLADAIGGELGASRPVCDEGWVPLQRQIGSSGQVVAPKLYLALGISGASQHLMGMKGSHTIVAVNKDPKAPIFAVADYGIVGDVMEVMPVLIDALKG